MARYKNDPRIITARFESICAETHEIIKKGEECVYYPLSKSVFSSNSGQFKEYMEMQFDWDNGF